MKSLIPMDDYGVFVDKHDTARVDSRYVAQFLKRNTEPVLRDIRELDCSKEFRLHNFVQSAYINEQGHKQPCYIMTRDGFVFLAMGYRGKRRHSSRNCTYAVSTRWSLSSERLYRQGRNFLCLPRISVLSTTTRSLITSAMNAICSTVLYLA